MGQDSPFQISWSNLVSHSFRLLVMEPVIENVDDVAALAHCREVLMSVFQRVGGESVPDGQFRKRLQVLLDHMRTSKELARGQRTPYFRQFLKFLNENGHEKEAKLFLEVLGNSKQLRSFPG